MKKIGEVASIWASGRLLVWHAYLDPLKECREKNWAVWIWKEFLEDKIQLWSPPIQFEARVNDFCYQDVLQIRFLGVAGSSSTCMQSIRSPIQCNPFACQRANLANMNNQIHLLAKEPDHDLDLSILHPGQSYFLWFLGLLFLIDTENKNGTEHTSYSKLYSTWLVVCVLCMQYMGLELSTLHSLFDLPWTWHASKALYYFLPKRSICCQDFPLYCIAQNPCWLK